MLDVGRFSREDTVGGTDGAEEDGGVCRVSRENRSRPLEEAASVQQEKGDCAQYWVLFESGFGSGSEEKSEDVEEKRERN